MNEIKQILDPEAFLEQTRKVFQEREQEFQMRERIFQEKNASLQTLLAEIAENRRLVEEKQEKLDQQRDILREQERQFEEQRLQVTEVQKEAQNLVMQHNLEIEKLRNEEMKLERLTTKYEYEISLMENGLTEQLKNEKTVDLTNYIQLSEHEQIIQELMEQNNQLQKEKTDFMKRILELDAQVKNQRDLTDIDSSSDKSGEETQNQSEAKGEEAKETERERGDLDEVVEEELTAEVLKSYLEKNEAEMSNIVIRHSEEGKQLYAERGDLQYQILFSKPAFFDITAVRKNSSRLRKLLAELNKQYAGIQFRYEDTENKVYATGYFTNDIKPYELMQRIHEISNCFSQE